jgi:hypothetical protein
MENHNETPNYYILIKMFFFFKKRKAENVVLKLQRELWDKDVDLVIQMEMRMEAWQ